MQYLIALLLATAAYPAAAQTASGRPLETQVCFYTELDYRGDAHCFFADRNTLPAGQDNQFSSVRLGQNANLTVWDGPNRTGAIQTIATNRNLTAFEALGTPAFDNRISSFDIDIFGDEADQLIRCGLHPVTVTLSDVVGGSVIAPFGGHMTVAHAVGSCEVPIERQDNTTANSARWALYGAAENNQNYAPQCTVLSSTSTPSVVVVEDGAVRTVDHQMNATSFGCR